MTPEQQDAAVDDLLERLLGLPPAERHAALERLTPHQPEIRARVASLLSQRSTGSFRGLLPSAPIRLTRPPATTGALPAIPGYDLLAEIGRGGMGAVYKARQQKLDRVVALKVILHGEYADQTDRQRFQNEAEAVARLQHPNIVQIFEVGEHDGRPYLALEYADGGSLDRQLDGTPQPAKQAAETVRTLALALQHAHERGVIHRDLKPANVLLGEGGALKVTDFGLARKVDVSGDTRSGAVLGTPSYMAPEQAAGRGKHVSTNC
jgi:serine/threonine-protein kinase